MSRTGEPVEESRHAGRAVVGLDESTGADLLVVGSPGLGGFGGLLLGSVSQQCVLHTTRPTVVVPSPR
jgi:nucleotide-binding universal stress UspA family protein